MTVSEIKQIVLDAVAVKEKSDNYFAFILQDRIESFLFKFEQTMEITIDECLDDKQKVPLNIEEIAFELRECYSL
jgi:hypothetical protein